VYLYKKPKMEKNILNEIDQMKYLVNYKAGRVISEQIKPSETVSEQFRYTKGGEDVSEVISTKDKDFKIISSQPNLWNSRVYSSLEMEYKYDKNTKTGKIGYVKTEGGLLKKKTESFVEGYSPYAQDVAKKMMNKMDETSLNVFNQMSQNNPLFYAYSLHKFDYSVVRANTGAFSDYKKLGIIVDSAETVKMPPPQQPTEPTEVIEPAVDIVSKRELVQPNFFAYNEATLTPQFKAYIDENIISNLNQTKQLLQKHGGTNKGVLDSLTINASSSQLRNGESKTVENDGRNCSTNPVTKKPFPACPTHLTLSKARAEAAKNYVLEELRKNGIEVDESKIVLNYQGENGDGTSGPAFAQGDNPKDEKFLKAQRVDVDAVIAIRTQEPAKAIITPPEIKQAEPVSQTDYRVVIGAKTRGDIEFMGFDFSGLGNIFGGFRSSGRGSNASLKQVRCFPQRRLQ
jgi:hypothetical protein